MTRLDFAGETGINISDYLNRTRTLNQSTDDSGTNRIFDVSKTTQRRKKINSFHLYPGNKTINLNEGGLVSNRKKAYASRARIKRLKNKNKKLQK